MTVLSATTRPIARGCVLTLTGELDFHTSPLVHQVLAGITLLPGQVLVIDLGPLTFCDSSGLTTLIAAYNRTRAAQATLALAAPRDNLTRTLRIVGLEQILPTYATVEAAVHA